VIADHSGSLRVQIKLSRAVTSVSSLVYVLSSVHEEDGILISQNSQNEVGLHDLRVTGRDDQHAAAGRKR